MITEMATRRETSEKDKKAAASKSHFVHPGSGDFPARGSRSSQGLVSISPQAETLGSQNRAGTPTKRVSLTAVRRKPEVDGEFSVEPDLDWREFTRSNSSLRFSSVRSYSSLSRDSSQDDGGLVFKHEEVVLSDLQDPPSESQSEKVVVSAVQKLSLSEKGAQPQNQPAEDNKTDDDEEEESDKDEDPSSPEDEVRKAPTELLMEFLGCVMKKDFLNAEKLCRMVLIYEPNNPEALLFHPLIMEKIELDASAEGEEDGNDNVDSGDDDDDEGEDDEDDDDDDDSDSSSSDSGDNEEGEAGDNEIQPPRPDSGIGL